MMGRGCGCSSQIQDARRERRVQSVGVPGGRYPKDRTPTRVSRANSFNAASIKVSPFAGDANQVLYSAWWPPATISRPEPFSVAKEIRPIKSPVAEDSETVIGMFLSF